MKTPLRRGLAALTLTAATLTGTAVTLAADLGETTTADTTWGAPDTEATTVTPPAPATDPVATPLDTTWG